MSLLRHWRANRKGMLDAPEPPLGPEPVEVAFPADTPPGFSCHRHITTGVLMVSQPGTRNQEALKAERDSYGREVWQQVLVLP